jgi:uncharacterized membrane protein YkvI
MNQAKLLKIVNVLLFLSVLTQVTTVVIFKTIGGSEAIGELHEINGYVFIALIITHLVLNWNWIKSVLFKKKIKS